MGDVSTSVVANIPNNHINSPPASFKSFKLLEEVGKMKKHQFPAQAKINFEAWLTTNKDILTAQLLANAGSRNTNEMENNCIFNFFHFNGDNLFTLVHCKKYRLKRQRDLQNCPQKVGRGLYAFFSSKASTFVPVYLQLVTYKPMPWNTFSR